MGKQIQAEKIQKGQRERESTVSKGANNKPSQNTNQNTTANVETEIQLRDSCRSI